MKLAPLVPPGPPLTTEEIARYSRHLLLPEIGVEGQRRLRGARVLVIGAGGLGAPVLQYLAAAGVGTIGIVDDDVIETSNLQRQVIHHADSVGTSKVDSAAEAVAALNPGVHVRRHRERLTSANIEEVLADYQLVLDGADNFPTRYLVGDAAARAGIPVVWGSILRFDAQVSVFWSRPVAADGAAMDGEAAGEELRGVTLRDLFPTPPPPGSTPSCGEAGVLGALCGQVGSLMATEAVKLLVGAGDPLFGRVAVLDVLRPSVTVVPLRARRAADGESPDGELDELGRPADPARRGYLLPAEVAAGLTLEGVCAPGATETTQGVPMADETEIPQMSVTELDEALKRREAGEEDAGLGGKPAVLVDVRPESERAIASIPGSEPILLDEILADPEGVAREHGLGDKHVMLHCLAGGRSQRAAEALAGAGVDVANVSGGIRAWAEQVDPDMPRY